MARRPYDSDPPCKRRKERGEEKEEEETERKRMRRCLREETQTLLRRGQNKTEGRLASNPDAIGELCFPFTNSLYHLSCSSFLCYSTHSLFSITLLLLPHPSICANDTFSRETLHWQYSLNFAPILSLLSHIICSLGTLLWPAFLVWALFLFLLTFAYTPVPSLLSSSYSSFTATLFPLKKESCNPYPCLYTRLLSLSLLCPLFSPLFSLSFLFSSLSSLLFSLHLFFFFLSPLVSFSSPLLSSLSSVLNYTCSYMNETEFCCHHFTNPPYPILSALSHTLSLSSYLPLSPPLTPPISSHLSYAPTILPHASAP